VRQNTGVDQSVTSSWRLITDWLSSDLPMALGSIEPPASEADIEQVTAVLGRELPVDLVEWLRLANGMVVRSSIGSILPTLYTPLACEAMLRHWDGLSRSFGGAQPRPGDTDPAGSRSFDWLDRFLPVAESASDPVLVVDLREGDLHGCIGVFDLESEGFEEHMWASTAHMLSDVAQALVDGRPALKDYADRASRPGRHLSAHAPVKEDGRLGWRPVAAPSSEHSVQ
jgi:cell wall assembly regulator SMI1